MRHLSFTQLLSYVLGIPISLYHFGISSSRRFRGLRLGRRPSGWCFTLRSCWCHQLDVCPPPDLLVCCVLCWLHVYLLSNFFFPDHINSGLSRSFSEWLYILLYLFISHNVPKPPSFGYVVTVTSIMWST